MQYTGNIYKEVEGLFEISDMLKNVQEYKSEFSKYYYK